MRVRMDVMNAFLWACADCYIYYKLYLTEH